MGIIFPIVIIRLAREDARDRSGTLAAAMKRLFSSAASIPTTATQIMSSAIPSGAPATLAGDVLPVLADGGDEAVPVLDGIQLVGIITRSDLVSALAHGTFGR